MYSYRTGLGDFNTDGFDNTSISTLIWLVFVAETLLIQIVLLNLLIAIMGDTFNKVSEKKEESKLREMCQLIQEYEYVLNRETVFKYSKYIIVTKIEKAKTNVTSDWEGTINTLKNNFSEVVTDLRKENMQ